METKCCASAEKFGGNCGASSDTIAFNCANTLSKFAPENGNLPVAISIKLSPKLQTSDREV